MSATIPDWILEAAARHAELQAAGWPRDPSLPEQTPWMREFLGELPGDSPAPQVVAVARSGGIPQPAGRLSIKYGKDGAWRDHNGIWWRPGK
jgi:hypothetical protein